MAVDAKTTAGGVVIVAIGGGSGYAINKIVNSKDQITLESIVSSDTEGTIAKTIKDAGFELLTETSPDAEWNNLVGKNTETNKEELQAVCKKLLVKNYQPDNEYLDAIKKCTKLQTIKERVEAWGLVPLKAENPEGQSTNSDESTWTTRAAATDKNAIDITTPTKTATTLKAACKTAGGKNHFDEDFNSTLWENYLKGCVKETNNTTPTHTVALTYSYWTKKEKVTVESKLSESGFQKQDSYTNDTTNKCSEKVNWEYNIDTYKGIAVLCAKNKTLKNKAVTGLELQVLPESEYQTKWEGDENIRRAMRSLDATITSDTWSSEFQAKIKAQCESETQITSEATQEQWVNYLLACTKDKDNDANKKVALISKKDFWTGSNV